ncbi:MAG: PTS sugar transporter subunit IIA [Eubacteriales bacterium]
MSANTLLNNNIIDLDLDAKTKDELFNKIAKKLFDNSCLKAIDPFINEIKKQESISTTNMGNGVAMIAIASSSVAKTSFMVIKTTSEIDWEDYNTPVNYVFLLAGIHHTVIDEYKNSLMNLSNLIYTKNFVQSINNAKKASAMIQKLNL